MTSRKNKKLLSIILVLTMILTLVPATLGFAAYDSLEAFVENVYKAVYERVPDEEGFNWWVEKLSNQEQTACQFIGFVLLDAPEFKEKFANISNEQFVKKLYNVLFNREADAEGLKFWVEQLQKGYSRKYVIYAMMQDVTNAEFLTFCENVGIKVGRLKLDASDYPAPKPEELEVVGVSANNLKEVVVEFNQVVDKDTAERLASYSINESVVIDNAELMADGKTVILTVVGNLTNQKTYKLTVRRAVAGAKVLSNKEVEFTPLDVYVPEVVSVDALGTKAIKVLFSEPINTVAINNFKLNGNAISGTIDSEGRTVIIRPFATLVEGIHTLEVSGVKDYANLQVIKTAIDFVVDKDQIAPAVASIKATPESVTVKFTEPVQPNTVKGGDYAYWKATTTTTVKSKADSGLAERIADDTFRFTFSGNNKLPLNEVYFYLEGVKDYSDNVIDKDTPVIVKAILDDVRPEVLEVKLNDDRNAITVEFSKSIKNISDTAKYTLLNKDGDKIAIRRVSKNADNTIATVELYSALGEGTYTFKMSGLTDDTILENAILPYETTIEVGDVEAPDVKFVSVSGREVYIQFSEPMALTGEGSILRKENYLVTYGGATRLLFSDATIALADTAGRSIIITMPEKISNENYNPASLTQLIVQRVEDLDGNVLENYSKTFILPNDAKPFSIEKAELTGKKTVVIEFTQSLDPSTVQAEDFVFDNEDNLVSSVEVEGPKVTLTLKENRYNIGNLSIDARKIKSVIGVENAEIEVGVTDKVKPEMKKVTVDLVNKKIKVEFYENIRVVETYLVADLEIKVNNNKLATEKYSIDAVDENQNYFEITIENDVVLDGNSVVTVKLNDGRFVMDYSDNSAVPFDITEAEKINE